ncbi:MAG: 3-hydroxyacyl-CoA dehydrogenase [Solirubrobacteraceae bacterium]
MSQIEGNSALVSGGASGLGEATVRRLHADGGYITIADVQDERGKALADELGARVQFVRTDVTDEEQVRTAVAAAAEAGPLVAAVSCAGIGSAQQTYHHKKGPHPLDAFRRVIEVNLYGTFNIQRLAAESMAANDPNEDGERGVLVNTASVAAFDGQIGQVGYSASKGAIVGTTLPVARDLARYGIRNVTIAPGLFDTPLLASLPQEAKDSLGKQVPFPPRLGKTSEYADLAAHIVGNPLLNGEVIRLDGAIRMTPQ